MGNIILNNIKINKTKQEIGLDVPNLEIPTEKMVAIIAAKDGGKTDLLKIVCGKTHPQQGTVTYEDGALNKGDLFYITSKTYEPAYLTVKDLINKSEKEYPNFNREVAMKYFAAMEIPTERIRYRNFQRMVQTAINCILAIASRARITVLDQPCRDMPLKLREMLYGFAKEDFAEFKRTIFITSNIAVDVDQVVEHVIYMRQGRVVFNLPYEEVDKFAVGLLGKNEVIKNNIGKSEVFYSAAAPDNLVHKVVRNNMSLDVMKNLQLDGVITQYVNLINFHTYVVKEDFGFEEKARLREEEEKIKAELKAKKENKKKKNKNVTLVAKDDSAAVASTPKQEEKKETFGEKLKRIMNSDIF